MKAVHWVKWLAWPLRSRKVHTAVATVVAAYLAHAGLEVSSEVIYGIVGIGASLILGIAHEDAGAKSAGKAPTPED